MPKKLASEITTTATITATRLLPSLLTPSFRSRPELEKLRRKSSILKFIRFRWILKTISKVFSSAVASRLQLRFSCFENLEIFNEEVNGKVQRRAIWQPQSPETYRPFNPNRLLFFFRLLQSRSSLKFEGVIIYL